MLYPRKLFKMYRSPGHRRQQGVVIVIALFIVALVATMAYVMMARLSRDTRRTELILHDTQAELYAQGSVIWAKDQLTNDWLKQKPDKPVDVMPLKSPVNDMNGYAISSTITDAQDKFNLNNVSRPEWQKAFTRLIQLVYPKITDQEATDITKATFDWVMPGNREDEYERYYAGLPVPYRPAHRFMIDPSELRLVKGVTPQIYAALQPYITALPAITAINPNTAPPPVLALISPIMTLSSAAQLKEALEKQRPKKLEDFLKMDIAKNHQVDEKRIAWVSEYFYVRTEVAVQSQDILLYTLMYRNTSGGRPAVTILWQNRGSA